jgi:hypothetical protein
MTIAILDWSSLINESRGLPIAGESQPDGPRRSVFKPSPQDRGYETSRRGAAGSSVARPRRNDRSQRTKVTNAKGLHSRGFSETLLGQGLATLQQGGGAIELIERLRLQVGRLEVSPDLLEGPNERNALLKTMFLAFRDAGAKDWCSNLAIALDHLGSQHRLQFHHVFPKAVLKSSYTCSEADDIAKLAFIGGKTNRSISDKPLVAYFPALLEKSDLATLDAQWIPIDAALLDVEAYKAFLARGRELIAAHLNDFLGTTTPPPP